jgi:putative SOS response-associated peptidase YedK
VERPAEPRPSGNPAQSRNRSGYRLTRCAGALFPKGQDPKGGGKPINAKCETLDRLPIFRDAYRRRRCIVPFDGFFEWKAIKGKKNKAVAMKDGRPFGIGGLWEN